MEKIYEAAVGTFFQLLFNQLANPLVAEFQRLIGVEEELRKLQHTVKCIQARLRDAEGQRGDESLALWLRDLEAAAYAAEDVIDRFYYEAFRCRVVGGGGGESTVEQHSPPAPLRRRDRAFNFITTLSSPKKITFRHNLGGEIIEVCSRLEDISKRHSSLPGVGSPSGRISSPSVNSRETTSLVSEPYLFGRESEKEEVLSLLLSGSDRLSVLPIVGIGGVGKTTLAQLAYNDERVEDHFHDRVWVCVTENFDVKWVTRQMFAAVADDGSRDFGNLNTLQESLRGKFEGKRILVVFDDLWNDDRDEWLVLRAPLGSAAKGSKVIVTTRHMSVADTVGTLDPIRLKGLSLKDSWSLLQKCASARGSFQTFLATTEEETCRKIIDRVEGLPLAVKTAAGILASSVAEEASCRVDTLERDFWEWPQRDGDTAGILPSLKLSYDRLPLQLKKCFAYCSLFPKGYQFDKSKLVGHWMAHGFVQAANGKRMEDEGGDCFDELCRRCFFTKVEGGCDRRYVMHNLFHELASLASKGECGRIESEKNTSRRPLDPYCRHVSFSTSDLRALEMKLSGLTTSLRSLLYVSLDGGGGLPQCSDSLFEKLMCLRVLDLSESHISSLPENIGELKHLRLLDVSRTRIAELPESVSRLYNLYVLRVYKCSHLKRLPSGVLDLINLRHLTASIQLISLLPGLGRLTSLQELEQFNASAEEGFKVSELRHLNELRGRLCISELQNVESEEEACQASLKKKESLDELELVWPTHCYSTAGGAKKELELHGRVLKNLIPPPKLKILSVKGNGGLQFPVWMMNQHLLGNLRSIHLRDCRNWRLLPALGRLPSLTSVKLEYILSVEEIGSEFFGTESAFPSLEVLVLRHLHRWKICPAVTRARTFPHLKKMEVEDCPMLETIFLPPSLKSLKVEKCPRLLNAHTFGRMTSLPSLASLSWSLENSYSDVRSCVAETMQHLTVLERLEICYCDERVAMESWLKRPEWIPYNYSQGRATDEMSQLASASAPRRDSCSGGARFFLLYTTNFCEYDTVANCRYACLRVRISCRGEEQDYNSLSTCLRDNLCRSLKHLTVNGCPDAASLLGGTVCLDLTSLEQLEMEDCRGVRSLEWLSQQQELTSVRELKVANCQDFAALPRLKLPALEKLRVEHCENLLSMDLHELASLTQLELNGCPKLCSGLLSHNLTGLQELRIRCCPRLVSFSGAEDVDFGGLVSLEFLEIKNCDEIKQLPPNLRAIPSLRCLWVRDCPAIESLPESGLPPSLEELRIDGCRLLAERCQADGPDYSKIANIPRIRIPCPNCPPFRCHCNNSKTLLHL